MRAFIAVNLEQQIRTEIEHIQRDMQNMVRGFRWVNKDLLHITLKFLGDIEQSAISNISRAMEAIAPKHTSFTLSFAGMGTFPTLKKPRIIWIGIEKGVTELTDLAWDIEKTLKDINGERVNRHDYFKAHITIGRAKKNGTSHILQDALTRQWRCAGTLSVDSFFLMESQLASSGPVYRPVRKFLLK
jgi:RNA 2',3'-cyclic 3'-phosphodiesterase